MGVRSARKDSVTPRYVHKLFENEGLTFSSFVLGQRLSRACRIIRTLLRPSFLSGGGGIRAFVSAGAGIVGNKLSA
jgi:hypothetical protein